MNGELDKLSQANPERKKWDAHYYRTRAGADYTHLFDRFELNANGNFGLSNFNYQPGAFTANKNSLRGMCRQVSASPTKPLLSVSTPQPEY